MIKAIKELREGLLKSLSLSELTFALYESTSQVHLSAEDFYKQYNTEEIQKGQCVITAKIDCPEDVVAVFSVRDMQGCAGILILHDLYVMPKFRKKGVGTFILRFVKEFAKHYGYALIQATDVESNAEGKKLLIKEGFSESDIFTNPKTKNVVVLWKANLQ